MDSAKRSGTKLKIVLFNHTMIKEHTKVMLDEEKWRKLLSLSKDLILKMKQSYGDEIAETVIGWEALNEPNMMKYFDSRIEWSYIQRFVLEGTKMLINEFPDKQIIIGTNTPQDAGYFTWMINDGMMDRGNRTFELRFYNDDPNTMPVHNYILPPGVGFAVGEASMNIRGELGKSIAAQTIEKAYNNGSQYLFFWYDNKFEKDYFFSPTEFDRIFDFFSKK